jgi:hypothetical protein
LVTIKVAAGTGGAPRWGSRFKQPKTLDEVAVFDGEGTELASRPLAHDAPGPDAWTRAVANLGYARVTPWTPT